MNPRLPWIARSVAIVKLPPRAHAQLDDLPLGGKSEAEAYFKRPLKDLRYKAPAVNAPAAVINPVRITALET